MWRNLTLLGEFGIEVDAVLPMIYESLTDGVIYTDEVIGKLVWGFLPEEESNAYFDLYPFESDGVRPEPTKRERFISNAEQLERTFTECFKELKQEYVEDLYTVTSLGVNNIRVNQLEVTQTCLVLLR